MSESPSPQQHSNFKDLLEARGQKWKKNEFRIFSFFFLKNSIKIVRIADK